MIPVIVLVGCEKTGKTSIFNKLSNNNLFLNFFFKTKTKKYSLCLCNNYLFLLVDTPSIKNYKNIEYNLNLYLYNCDIILFIKDFDSYNNYINYLISNYLRKFNKYIFLLINKFDNNKLYEKLNNLDLNFGCPFLISSLHNFKLKESFMSILNIYCLNKTCSNLNLKIKNFSVFLLGPNHSGKITFTFSLLKNKSIFFKKSLFFYLKYKNIYFKFINSLFFNKSIKNFFKKIIVSNLVLYFINPIKILNNLDFKIYDLILDNYLNIIFIINKSDFLNLYEKYIFKKLLKKKIKIKNYYFLFFSSLFDYNLTHFKIIIKKIYYYSFINLNTNKLNKIILNFSKFLKIYYKHIINIKYVHQGGKNPILIIIHSKNKNKIKKYYKEFLKKILFKKLKIKGIPLKIKI